MKLKTAVLFNLCIKLCSSHHGYRFDVPKASESTKTMSGQLKQVCLFFLNTKALKFKQVSVQRDKMSVDIN